jgi:glyoxylase-like metal-dependent hydrolase (beta-lactamase superfamily II)
VFGRAELVLLDCGPGVLERLWARGLAHRLDAIVVTHMHMDHVLDLLPFSAEVTLAELRKRGGYRRPVLSSAFFDGLSAGCLVAAGVSAAGAVLAAALLPAQPLRTGLEAGGVPVTE